jgi:hypothetical protein
MGPPGDQRPPDPSSAIGAGLGADPGTCLY